MGVEDKRWLTRRLTRWGARVKDTAQDHDGLYTAGRCMTTRPFRCAPCWDPCGNDRHTR